MATLDTSRGLVAGSIVTGDAGHLTPAKLKGVLDGMIDEIADEIDAVSGATPALVAIDATVVVAEAWATAQLAADNAHGLIYFVPAGATVYVDVPSQKATIDEALDAVARWIPAPDSSIVIRIASGIYTRDMQLTTNGNGEIVVDHPFGNRLSIQAASGYGALTFSSLGTITNTGSGNHSVVVNVTNASSVAVGDWLRISATTGTGDHYTLRGFWEVTGKATNAITLKVTDKRTSWNATTVSAMTVQKVPVLFKFTNPSGSEFYGLDVRTSLGDASGIGSALNGFSAIGLVGPNSGSANSGIRVSYGAKLYSASGSINVGNFGRNGIWCFGASHTYLDAAAVTNCGTTGLAFLEGANGQIIRTIANGCVVGISATTGAAVSASQTVVCGNTRGFDAADRGGGISAGSCICWGNATGFRAQQGGFGSVASATFGYNTTGCKVEVSGGRISVASISNTSNTTDYNPVLNLLDGDSLIYDASGPTLLGVGGNTLFVTATAVLDFPSIAAGATAELPMTVTGATVGCAVALGTTAAWNAGLVVTGVCTTLNTVTVRVANITGSAIDPTSKTVRATCILLT